MFQFLAATGAGAVATLFSTVLQLILQTITDAITSVLFFIAATILQAMCIGPDEVNKMLWDKTDVSEIATLPPVQIITVIGVSLAAIFILWEFIKILWSYVTGEGQKVRVQTIIINGFVFGIWAFCAIPVSNLIFSVGSTIYKGIYDVTFNQEGGVFNFFGRIIEIFRINPDTLAEDGKALLGNSATDLVLSLVWSLVGTVLIVLVMWNFLKLLFGTFVRFSALIFYVYLSPLAVGCGVSPKWQGVTWSWLKNFISTLVLWITNIWSVYLCLRLMAGGQGRTNSAFVMWAGICYGFVTSALHLDQILNDVGLSITRSSGSVLGDMREIGMAAARAITHVSTAGRAMNAAAKAAKGGTGLGRASALFPKGNIAGNPARNKGQIARDMATAAMAESRLGNAVLQGVSGMQALGDSKKSMRDELAGNAKNAAAYKAMDNLSKINEKYCENGMPPEKGTNDDKQFKKELDGVYKDLESSGMSRQELSNNDGAKKWAEEHVGFSDNPKDGSMKDHGFDCVGVNVGENGNVSALFEKKQENGSVRGKSRVDNIGRLGNPAQNPNPGGEKKETMKTGEQAGRPAFSRNQYGNIVTGSHQHEFSMPGASESGMNWGHSSTIKDADTGNAWTVSKMPSEDGKNLFRAQERNAHGDLISDYKVEGKNNATTDDIARDLQAGTKDHFATVKDGKLEKPVEPVSLNENLTATSAANEVSRIMNASRNQNGTLPSISTPEGQSMMAKVNNTMQKANQQGESNVYSNPAVLKNLEKTIANPENPSQSLADAGISIRQAKMGNDGTFDVVTEQRDDNKNVSRRSHITGVGAGITGGDTSLLTGNMKASVDVGRGEVSNSFISRHAELNGTIDGQNCKVSVDNVPGDKKYTITAKDDAGNVVRRLECEQSPTVNPGVVGQAAMLGLVDNAPQTESAPYHKPQVGTETIPSTVYPVKNTTPAEVPYIHEPDVPVNVRESGVENATLQELGQRGIKYNVRKGDYTFGGIQGCKIAEIQSGDVPLRPNKVGGKETTSFAITSPMEGNNARVLGYFNVDKEKAAELSALHSNEQQGQFQDLVDAASKAGRLLETAAGIFLGNNK